MLVWVRVPFEVLISYNKETSLNTLFNMLLLNRVFKDVLLFLEIKVTLCVYL